jgi:hypothetical protein
VNLGYRPSYPVRACPNFGMGNKIIFSIFDFWEKFGNFYFYFLNVLFKKIIATLVTLILKKIKNQLGSGHGGNVVAFIHICTKK